MKKSFFVIWLVNIAFLVSAQQPIFQRVKICCDSQSTNALFATGIPIVAADKSEGCFLAEITREQVQNLSNAGFQPEVLIPDMAEYYTQHFHDKTPLSETEKLLAEEWPQPVNFSLGSCGGFSTVDEMIAQLDLMRSLYPELISVKQALNDTLTTIEGHTIYFVRISDNPDVNESEPEVLYTGMHHAREPIGMQHLLYYMWYLLENYSTDSSVSSIVNNTELYFVPVFNVDGYSYNISTQPDGGGMWRKNRRDNGDGSFGIDINRNYGYQWGFDDIGSSPDPFDDTYRGTGPFSEPETRMMKYFCEAHDFRIALNYHSYSNLFLYPWGWSEVATPDNAVFDAYSVLMTKENNYTYGPGSTTIYPTNGGSDDWMYGEQTAKPLIMSYTPEVGGNDDGFWPTQQRILPLIQENMLASITAAQLVGNYGIVSDASPLFIYETEGFLPFNTKRLGMQDGDFMVSITPLGDGFASIGGTKLIEGLTLLESRTDSISYQLSNTLNVGDTIQYVLTINNGTFVENDTVTRIFGYPVSVFNDDMSTMDNWTGTWALTSSQYFSPATSMTDSPNGNYTANANRSVITVNEIELDNTLLMVLQFRAKWALEKDYDYVQISISENNGSTWIPLQGIYTTPGSPNQASGQPLYDGVKSEWIREAISLNEYMGKKVKFRFRLRADQGVQLDGFYFDDFNISMVLDPTSVTDSEKNPLMLGNPYPNPADGFFEVSYVMQQKSVAQSEMILTTPSGMVVSRTRLSQKSGTIKTDTRNLAPGIYFLTIQADGLHSPVCKVIVK